MSNRMRCPDCNHVIECVNWTGTYEESGSCTGHRNIGEYDEQDDCDCNNGEHDVEEYTCPECEAVIDYEYIENAESSDMTIYSEDGEDNDEDSNDITQGNRVEMPTGAKDCKRCKYPLLFVEIDNGEKECPICSTINKLKE
jgi:uncharacterized protein (UPF0212 family)